MRDVGANRATQGAPAAAADSGTDRQRQIASMVKMAERNPDQAEGDEMHAGEVFMVGKNAEKECAARRKILQKADSR